MKKINIQSVNSLEEYLFQLGALCVSLQTLKKLHELCESRGIFNDDETENCKTIMYRIERLLTCVDDQIRMCCGRTPNPWEEILKKVVECIPKNRKH